MDSGEPTTTQSTAIPATNAASLRLDGHLGRRRSKAMSAYGTMAARDASIAGACPGGCSVSRNATSAVVSAGLRFFSMGAVRPVHKMRRILETLLVRRHQLDGER